MLFRAFPPAERAKASTVVMVPTLIAPAAGPVIGGLITTHFDWRWIFLVNVPVSVAALWFAWRHLREHREPSARGFDVAGFVLSGAALALVVYALSEGWQAGWTSALVLGTGAAGLLCAALTVVVELRVQNPMLELRLFGDRMFRVCNGVGFFSMASFLGITFVMPLYLQNVRGLTPLSSGLTTFPQALGVMASSMIAGRLYMRVGPRRLMFGGFFSSSLAIALFMMIDAGTSLWMIRGLLLLRGFCVGFAFVPMQAASYSTIPPAQNGRASSIFSTQRQVGISVGVAVLASVLSSFGVMRPHRYLTEVSRAITGVRWAFAVSVGLALTGALLSLLVRDSEAKGTMGTRTAEG
jgi:EmrB/QacA subfamily drug resistance transporter